MIFQVLKRAVAAAEEKTFYVVALIYLNSIGYRGLSITDGPGDGGRDVTSDRKDLVIQLSVRKDWRLKINEEAARAKAIGRRHIIYITNRLISLSEERDFFSTYYKCSGEVDVTIHDLNKISSGLVYPKYVSEACQALGLALPSNVEAEPKDIALSSVMLFSSEASNLRDEIIEANIKSVLHKKGPMSESDLIVRATAQLPWVNTDVALSRHISRLRGGGKLIGKASSTSLSVAESEKMKAAQENYLAARQADIQFLKKELDIKEDIVEKLITCAEEILIRSGDFNSTDVRAENLRAFISSNGLSRRRVEIYEALSKCEITKFRQHSETIEKICLADSFDIYRALGQTTDLTVVLDSSVGIPMLCGLSFSAAHSRYGAAANALVQSCRHHGIRLAVPKSYLNEMASHGLRALEFLPVYNGLHSDLRSSLSASKNAYLSHFSHIVEVMAARGRTLTLHKFLNHFGIRDGVGIRYVEDRIENILLDYKINVFDDGKYDYGIYNEISKLKNGGEKILVEHDARVATYIKENTGRGFILSTWDKVLIDIVMRIGRVYADTPARIIDFLSLMRGHLDDDMSYDLLTILLHADERKSEELSRLVEGISSAEMAFEIKEIIDSVRSASSTDGGMRDADLIKIISEFKIPDS